MILLDTHILVDVLDGKLRPRELVKLQADAKWGIADITLWELAMLHRAGRISLDVGDTAVRSALAPLQVYPITPEVAAQSCRLDFQTDSADQLIAATSIVHNVPLMTRDAKIRASKLVRFA
jgi:PIN domain nuclease of toxin-antitoxin system